MVSAVPVETSVGETALRVERLAAGDRAEFDRLVRLNHARVTRLADRLLGWPDDVQDAVQEVFVSALTGISRFRGGSSIETWLARITINTCRSHRRRRLLRWRRAVPIARAARRETVRSPDPAAGDGELFERVRHAVQALPARDREVVVLRYLEEMPVQAVADLLHLRRNTVDVRLTRARAKLRAALGTVMMERFHGD